MRRNATFRQLWTSFFFCSFCLPDGREKERTGHRLSCRQGVDPKNPSGHHHRSWDGKSARLLFVSLFSRRIYRRFFWSAWLGGLDPGFPAGLVFCDIGMLWRVWICIFCALLVLGWDTGREGWGVHGLFGGEAARWGLGGCVLSRQLDLEVIYTPSFVSREQMSCDARDGDFLRHYM